MWFDCNLCACMRVAGVEKHAGFHAWVLLTPSTPGHLSLFSTLLSPLLGPSYKGNAEKGATAHWWDDEHARWAQPEQGSPRRPASGYPRWGASVGRDFCLPGQQVHSPQCLMDQLSGVFPPNHLEGSFMKGANEDLLASGATHLVPRATLWGRHGACPLFPRWGN